MPAGDYRTEDRKVTPPPRARIDESMEALDEAENFFESGRTVLGAALAARADALEAGAPEFADEGWERAERTAREAGRLVAFDSNIRPRLWEDAETMRGVLAEAAGVEVLSGIELSTWLDGDVHLLGYGFDPTNAALAETLARALADKAAHALLSTKRHVDAVTRQMVGTQHAWADAVRDDLGGVAPLARFGASDCACEAHLYRFRSRPSGAAEQIE